jgi:hypothetical protein
MSNALAIAAVTEALVQTLQEALTGINLGSTPQVTNTRPDQVAQLPQVGVNVFLYQIVPNPYLRNADVPTRNPDGPLLQRPTAAIDLHYLLTFHGDDTRLEQQRLLGAVVRELHANPVLTRSMIASVQQNTSFLVGSNLDQQRDLVRFTPMKFSLEELSKLWSFLLKTDYVLSTAYQASVVLIETDDPVPPPALPVLSSNVTALPFLQPVVTAIQSAAGAGALILAGSQIVITGLNFILQSPGSSQSSATEVQIDGIGVNATTITDTRIVLTLPQDLKAGARTVQILQSLNLGTPPTPHLLGFQSAPATFVLHPEIQHSGSPPFYQITVAPGGSGSPPGETVTVAVDPAARAGQRALLELLQVAQPTAARLIDGGVVAADTATLTFPIENLPAGTYLVRVRVDGAESPLALDPSGAPSAPSVSL